MTIYHKHHIIPRHMGGTDDPSNLIKLTVEEHAEAHKKLYEQYGLWQDQVAWKALSGQISVAEAIIESVKKSNTGRKVSEETRRKMSLASKGKSRPWVSKCMQGNTNNKGRTFSDEWKSNMSNSLIGNTNRKGIMHSEDAKRLISEKTSLALKGKKKPIVSCPHCNKSGGSSNMRRYHFDKCKDNPNTSLTL